MFIVLEINENKALGGHSAAGLDEAKEIFTRLVGEYGVEPYDELINEGFFEDENGFTVQILEIHVDGE